VSQLVIAKTLSVSPARKLRSVPGFPHISSREMHHARPALHTVFCATQLGRSNVTRHGFRDAFSIDRESEIEVLGLLDHLGECVLLADGIL